MSCEFTHYDGSYVLGALSAAERSEYRRHLSGCAECTAAVQGLVGLPGLLARVSPEVLESTHVEEPVPDALLPALVRQAREAQRRRWWVVAGAAAAAAVVVAVSSLAITASTDDEAPTVLPPSPGVSSNDQASQPMVPVGYEPVSADLALTPVAWGTRLEVTCTYESAGAQESSAAWDYAMFVRTRDGRLEQVASWRGLPGKTMQLAAATASSRDDISSVEIRTAGGKPVLKLAL